MRWILVMALDVSRLKKKGVHKVTIIKPEH
jgi:hypothetical protein